MSQILDNIKAELAAFNEKKKALTEQLREEFPAMFAPLFAQSKRINSFSWTQYTPYFNDGDSCTFGVRNEDIDINGTNLDDADGDIAFLDKYVYEPITAENQAAHDAFNASPEGRKWYVGYAIGKNGNFPNPAYDTAEGKVVQEIQALLGSIPDEFYEELFGDHKKITVHRSGEIEVEEYEHD